MAFLNIFSASSIFLFAAALLWLMIIAEHENALIVQVQVFGETLRDLAGQLTKLLFTVTFRTAVDLAQVLLRQFRTAFRRRR